MWKSGFSNQKGLLLKERIRSLWRDAVDYIPCLIQESPFDVGNYVSILATPKVMMESTMDKFFQ